MKSASIISRFSLLLFLLACLVMNGCAVVTTLPPTILPTVTASRIGTSTPVEVTTITPVRFRTSIPTATPLPTSTSDNSIRITPTPSSKETFQPDPDLLPTVVLDGKIYCDIVSACSRSPDGKWLVQSIGHWFVWGSVRAEDKPYLIIFRPDGTDVHKIYSNISYGNSGYLRYSPWFFDESGHWLFTGLMLDGFMDASIVYPIAFGMVKIEIETGQVVPLLGLNQYYGISLSPDGTKIGYTVFNMAGVLDLKTGERSLYALRYTYAIGVLWSPDGTRFVTDAISDLELEPWIANILLISPGSAQPVSVIFTHQWPVGSWEWDADDGILLKTYKGEEQPSEPVWIQINPDNPTPVPVPSPTPD